MNYLGQDIQGRNEFKTSIAPTDLFRKKQKKIVFFLNQLMQKCFIGFWVVHLNYKCFGNYYVNNVAALKLFYFKKSDTFGTPSQLTRQSVSFVSMFCVRYKFFLLL